jgi:formate/nitrite transporter
MSDLPESQVKALKPDALTPAEMAAKMEAVGVAKAGMKFSKQFPLSLLAGLFIGLGGTFFMMVLADPGLPFAIQRIVGGLVFCLGLFLVVCASAELFTGNNLLVAAAASKKISWGAVLKNWIIVWVGNLIGSLICVGIIYLTNYGGLAPELAIADQFVKVAAAKATIETLTLFFKALMCNLLVCLAIWLSFSARTLTDKLVAIIPPICAFVAMGFEHSVANMFFLPMGLLNKITGNYSASLDPATLDKLDISGIAYNISMVTLGNIVGGAILVGIVYWFVYNRKSAS